MKYGFASLIAVHLLLRGMVFAYPHTHMDCPQPSDHAVRPHVHLTGHSHSHRDHHSGHAHQSHGHHRHSHEAKGPLPEETPVSDHDEDAVYAVIPDLAEFGHSIEVRRPEIAGWYLAVRLDCTLQFLQQIVEHRAAGPPGMTVCQSDEFRPHLLRI